MSDKGPRARWPGRLRSESSAHVVVLTAKAEETDKVMGLSVGADNYVIKPFSPANSSPEFAQCSAGAAGGGLANEEDEPQPGSGLQQLQRRLGCSSSHWFPFVETFSTLSGQLAGHLRYVAPAPPGRQKGSLRLLTRGRSGISRAEVFELEYLARLFIGDAGEMYRRILIPVDGSPCSDVSLTHGLQLAKEQGAEVKVIHVLDTQTLYLLYEGIYIEEIAEKWRRAGQELVGRAAEQGRQAGISTATMLIEEGGRIPDAIVAESKRWPADLIVMGTHGRHGIDHLLLGSAAEGVVRTTSVPVLLIRKA